MKTTPGGRLRTKVVLTVVVLLVFVGSFLAKRLVGRPRPCEVLDARSCRRIVSMAPSITETLFALELGDRVVGVTRFCNYPARARQKARIGGHFDPNFEAIVALRPDLVVMLVEHEPSRTDFDRLGLGTLIVSHKTIEGILDSIPRIGRACGAEDRARTLAADIRARMERIGRKTAGRPRLRVMFAIDRMRGSGSLQDVYIAGADDYFDKIITLAGGQNACRVRSVRFPVVNAEGILRMNPEVIIDMVSGMSSTGDNPERILDDWQQLDQLEAVKSRRVHLFTEDYAFVPGPRFILLVEKLARLLHPELDWQ